MNDHLHDPIEDDPKFATILKEATEAALLELADHPERGKRGFYSFVESAKKRILKDKFGIDWKSPSDYPMNKIMGNMRD